MSIGVYPIDYATPCHQIDAGAWNDDEGHDFDVSITFPISAWGFTQLINDLNTNASPPLYNLSTYNCSTFAVEKLNHLGIIVPSTNVLSLDMPPVTGCHVEGMAPGQLGQDLRNSYQVPIDAIPNWTGGNSAASSCH